MPVLFGTADAGRGDARLVWVHGNPEPGFLPLGSRVSDPCLRGARVFNPRRTPADLAPEERGFSTRGAHPLSPHRKPQSRERWGLRLAWRGLGAARAPSLDARLGHPALGSLRVRCASASCLRLLPQPARGHGQPRAWFPAPRSAGFQPVPESSAGFQPAADFMPFGARVLNPRRTSADPASESPISEPCALAAGPHRSRDCGFLTPRVTPGKE